MATRRAYARRGVDGLPNSEAFKYLMPPQAFAPTVQGTYCGTGAYPDLDLVPSAVHAPPPEPVVVTFAGGGPMCKRRLLLETWLGPGSLLIPPWEAALNVVAALPGAVPAAHANVDLAGRPVAEIVHIWLVAAIYGSLPGAAPRGKWFESVMHEIVSTTPNQLPNGLPPGTPMVALYNVPGASCDGRYFSGEIDDDGKEIWPVLEYKVMRSSVQYKDSGFAYVNGMYYISPAEYALFVAEVAAGRGESGAIFVGVEMAGGEWCVLRRSVRAQVDAMVDVTPTLMQMHDGEDRELQFSCQLYAPIARLTRPFPPKPPRRRGLLDALVWRATVPEQGPYRGTAALLGNALPPATSPQPAAVYEARRGGLGQGGIFPNCGTDEYIPSTGFTWTAVLTGHM